MNGQTDAERLASLQRQLDRGGWSAAITLDLTQACWLFDLASQALQARTPEVIERAARAIHNARGCPCKMTTRENRADARAAIDAALRPTDA